MIKFFSALLSLIFFIQVIYSNTPDCEIISYASCFELNNNKLTETDSVVIQVNNRTGEMYTNITIPYSKDQRISDLNARIEDVSGRVVRTLKNSDITDRSAISDYSLYEDYFVKTFQLKHNTYPYQIIYSYKTICKQFIAIPWYPVIKYQVPTKQASLTLIIPKDCPINTYTTNIQDYKVETIDNKILHIWTSSYANPVRDEIYSLPEEKYLPKIIVIPLNFIYGVEGSAKDWKSFGNWLYRLMQGTDDLPEAEKNKVLQLIKGISDKREIIKILYHYMQDNTRYINVTIDIGGLKPYPASYVSINKYGDCKALTNYLKALLNAAGIPSFYTIVHADLQLPEVSDSIASPHFFNHVILTVPIGNDTVWLENTNNTLPFGYINTSIQNRKALLIEENNSRLIHIPAQSSVDVKVFRKMNIGFNETENTQCQLEFSFKGYDFEKFSSLYSHYNKNEQEKSIQEYIPFANFDLISWELQKINRDTAEIKLISKINLNKVLKSIGPEKYFNLIPMQIPSFSAPADRKNSVHLPYPIYLRDSVYYVMPKNYEPKTALENAQISTEYGNYKFSAKFTPSALIVYKSFELFPRTYSPEQYADFYKFLTSVKAIENRKVIIKRKD
jgi:hypothetical protein